MRSLRFLGRNIAGSVTITRLTPGHGCWRGLDNANSEFGHTALEFPTQNRKAANCLPSGMEAVLGGADALLRGTDGEIGITASIAYPSHTAASLSNAILWHGPCPILGMNEKPYRWISETMISTCSWCFPGKTVLDACPELPRHAQISHGICPEHKEMMLREIMSKLGNQPLTNKMKK